MFDKDIFNQLLTFFIYYLINKFELVSNIFLSTTQITFFNASFLYSISFFIFKIFIKIFIILLNKIILLFICSFHPFTLYIIKLTIINVWFIFLLFLKIIIYIRRFILIITEIKIIKVYCLFKCIFFYFILNLIKNILRYNI